jgi:tetratricopeptide (TPR) repeat protein
VSRRHLLLVFLLLLAAAPTAPVWADRSAAEFFHQRAEKALRAKRYAEAEADYARALAEDATLHPARLGLGEALLGLGRRDAAVECFRAVAAEAEAGRAQAPAADLVAKARKRLKELDAAGAALDALVDAHVASLIDVAGRWAGKDPDLAEAALRDVLRLRPSEKRASSMLEKMGKAPSGQWTAAFDGKSLTGWVWMNPPTWQVTDGTLVADVRDAAVIGRSEGRWKGDFDVRMEARLLEARAGGTYFALLGALKEEYVLTAFGIHDEQVALKEWHGESREREVFAARHAGLKRPFDPKDWNVYELQFRKDKIRAVVNGEVLSTIGRDPVRDEGHVGLKVQNCKVAFRRIDVLQQ